MKISEIFESGPAYLRELLFTTDGSTLEILSEERKWISGRFDRNIGIDQPNHLAGQHLLPGQKLPQAHAHVFGRKGDELGVVNFDGSSSHGTKAKLHDADADALRSKGFKISPDNIVEWIRLETQARIILNE